MPEKTSNNLVMIGSHSRLDCDKVLIESVDRICKEGSRVFLICPPQDGGREALAKRLPEQAAVFSVPVHMPEAERYDLADFLERSWSSPCQRFCSLILQLGLDDGAFTKIRSLPSVIGRPLEWIFDSLGKQVQQERKKALAEGRYWQHFMKQQLPPEMFRRYEKVIQLDCFGYFYFVQALIINKTVATLDSVYCHELWSLPAACLLKEILGVTLIYHSRGKGLESINEPRLRELAEANHHWMLQLCDQQICSATIEDLSVTRPAICEVRPLPAKPSRLSNKSLPLHRNATQSAASQPRLNVAVLFHEDSAEIETVFEHLNSFRRFLPHDVFYIPATVNDAVPTDLDLSLFDVVIVHYCVRLALPAFIDASLAQKLIDFSGIKLLFIQDEYDATETARSWMDRLVFDAVYTCVPEEYREFVYPAERFAETKFLPTLTGYVPEAEGLENFVLPLEERKIVIGYRGRILPFHYGILCYEKFLIGREVKRLAEARDIPVDIEVDDRMRIYGSGWYRFLGSVRSMLGTESGSNVFDFQGDLKEKVTNALRKNPDLSFYDIHSQFISEHDGLVKMNQISPKVFEAILFRTALVLFEGDYSFIIKPDLHYIPLKKDFSNIEDVFRKLEDLEYLRQMTERAYRDIIESRRYSYQRFVEGVNDDILSLMKRASSPRGIILQS